MSLSFNNTIFENYNFTIDWHILSWNFMVIFPKNNRRFFEVHQYRNQFVLQNIESKQ
jgi:hypothetical protein